MKACSAPSSGTKVFLKPPHDSAADPVPFVWRDRSSDNSRPRTYAAGQCAACGRTVESARGNISFGTGALSRVHAGANNGDGPSGKTVPRILLSLFVFGNHGAPRPVPRRRIDFHQ